MTHKSKQILVVGAAGGIGRHAVRALLAQGYVIVAIDRKNPVPFREMMDLTTHPLVTWHQADLERDPIEPYLKNIEVIVNCAGETGLADSYTEIVGPNVLLVDRLYSAARHMGVRQVIHLSAGLFYAQSSGLRTEEDTLDPRTDYARSKADAEKIFKTSEVGETHWTLLRPSYVYGPGCRSMSAGLVTLPPIIGDLVTYQPGFRSGSRITWCHVEDLAQAIVTVVDNPEAYEKIFNVADDTPQSAGEAITCITQAYGFHIGLVFSIPTTMMARFSQKVLTSETFAVGTKTVLRQLWRRVVRKHHLKTPLKPRLNAQGAYHLTHDLLLDTRCLAKLGWQPKWYSLRHGMPSTIKWYQEQGWIPDYDPAVLETLRLDAKPTLFTFEQTLIGSFSPDVVDLVPEQTRKSLESKWELLKRLKQNDSDLLGQQVILQVEVTLRSLIQGEGNIEGLVWIDGITMHYVEMVGTYTYNLKTNRFVIDFGFRDQDQHPYRVSLVGHRHRFFSRHRPQTFPSVFRGKIIDAKAQPVGTLNLNVVLAETLLSMLLGLR